MFRCKKRNRRTDLLRTLMISSFLSLFLMVSMAHGAGMGGSSQGPARSFCDGFFTG